MRNLRTWSGYALERVGPFEFSGTLALYAIPLPRLTVRFELQELGVGFHLGDVLGDPIIGVGASVTLPGAVADALARVWP